MSCRLLSTDPGITSLTLYIDSTEIFSRYVLFQEWPAYSSSLSFASPLSSFPALPTTVAVNQPYFLLLETSYTLTVNRVVQQPIAIGSQSIAMYALEFTRITTVTVSILDASQTSVVTQRVSTVCDNQDLMVRDVQVNQDGLELLALFYITDGSFNKCPRQNVDISVLFVGNTSALCILQYNTTVYPYNYLCRLMLPSGSCDVRERIECRYVITAMMDGSEIGKFTKQINSMSPTDSVSSIVCEGAGLSGGKFFDTNFILIHGLSTSSLVFISLVNSNDQSSFPY